MILVHFFLCLFSILLRILIHVGFVLDLRLYLISLYFGQQRFQVKKSQEQFLSKSAKELSTDIRNGSVKAEIIIRAFIKRIQEVNPLLNAVVGDRFEDAIDEAKQIDHILSNSDDSRGVKDDLLMRPLLGVPITVKESISVRGLSNSSGLVERKAFVAEQDSGVVANLRKAGAIPIAVTNCSELCMWWETVNNVYGRTNNPYDTTRIAGGSSGGEGAIVAAAGSVCGIGSDVGGSIRMPAFFNGIFGHKPSPGIVPNDGHFPYGTSEAFHEYLTIGPMCRHAEDLPLMLQTMAGPSVCRLRLNTPVDISSLRIFTVNDFQPLLMSYQSEELEVSETKLCEHLKERFHIKVEKANLELFSYSALIWAAKVMSSENKQLTSKFLDGNSAAVSPFTELAKYLSGFSQYHFITPVVGCLEKLHCFDALASTFVAFGNDLQRQLEALLGDDGVLLFPSHPSTAMTHGKPLLSPLDFNYTSIFNVLHMPVTQCPLGVDKQGLPLGIQVVSARDNDRLTLAVAMAIEEEFGGWKRWHPGRVEQ